MKNLLLLFILFSLVACQSDKAKKTAPTAEKIPTIEEKFRNALTFYNSFDGGTTADFALGDKNIYTAPSYRAIDSAEVGIHKMGHEILADKGQSGGAIQFGKKGIKSRKVLFHKSKDNIAYDAKNWTGTISFWLSVDPVTDLEPWYNDPIQITDTSYNDASIWVDFTDKDPRDFRLGVIGDKSVWTKDTLNAPVDTVFERRVVRVTELPFAKDKWTHVLISYSHLGSPQSTASLYMDGRKIGSVEGITDPFTWDLDKSIIFLGLGYTGLMDELSIFNKAFSEEDVRAFRQLAGGVKSLLD